MFDIICICTRMSKEMSCWSSTHISLFEVIKLNRDQDQHMHWSILGNRKLKQSLGLWSIQAEKSYWVDKEKHSEFIYNFINKVC